ncbi:unnamed protein product [Coregonus sp. 'balchen']|nr:unnamed protein product [Coregonus sp. 'balchen']
MLTTAVADLGMLPWSMAVTASRYLETNCSLDVGFVLFLCFSLGLLLFMLAVLFRQLAFCHILRG